VRRIVPFLALAVMIFATACGDTEPTSSRLSPSQPSAAISDGSRAGGNPDFFFLPLLARDPASFPNFDRNGFNPNLAPVIKVCRHSKTSPNDLRNPAFDCINDTPIATISGSGVRVFPQLQFYLAVWKTRDYDLHPDKVYRIQVFVGSKRLGFADVTIVTSTREAKNAITGDIVPFAEDWSLPIPFRIENGALGAACRNNADCTERSVGPAGGTFLTNSGFAGVTLTPGWASAAAFAAGGGTIQLTIERVVLGEGESCHDAESVTGRLIEELEGCYHYATDPDLDLFGGFQTAGNSVGQCSGLARTPANSGEDWLLYKSDPGKPLRKLEDTQGPPVNCADFAFFEGLPSNPLLRFASLKWHSVTRVASRVVGVKPAYAWDGGLGGVLDRLDGFSDISRGKGGQIAKIAGDNQSARIGQSVEDDPRIRITSVHVHAGDEGAHGLEGVNVTFTAAGGGNVGGEGSQVSRTVQTDEDGYASVPWYLGEGPNTLQVEAATLQPTVITFNAALIVGGSIAGTVSDVSGLPLDGARVRLVSTGDDSFEPRSMSTGEDGAYSFSDLPAGSYFVSAAAIGFDIVREFVPLDAGQNDITNLVLPRVLADFAISEFSVSPANPTTDVVVVYTIVVSNLGGADAPASVGTFSGGWSRADPPEAFVEVDPFFAIPAVPARGSITLTLTRGRLRAASWGATLTLNTGSEGVPVVPESNGLNNSRSVSFTVTPGP
jgi:carboxypeptidase family protein